MAPHSSIGAWRIPMDRGAMWAAVHGIAESDTTEQLKFLKINVYVPESQSRSRADWSVC